MEARARANELTLVAILVIVSMLFAAFSAAYLIRRTALDWQRVELPSVFWMNALVLLASSGTMRAARRTRARSWLAVTAALGIVFLGGQLLGWRALAGAGVFLPTSPHGSFLYTLSALHGVHLLGGLAALAYAATDRDRVGLCATYWDFLGGVWLYLLVLLTVL